MKQGSPDATSERPIWDSRANRSRLAAAVLLLVSALSVAYAMAGVGGLLAMVLGLAAAGFGVAGLVLATRLVAQAAAGQKPGSAGVLLPGLFFLFKLPVFVGIGMWVQGMGGAALSCFLAGVVLVYFGLVAWAAARHRE
jgi:hypothetical protein